MAQKPKLDSTKRFEISIKLEANEAVAASTQQLAAKGK